MVVLSLMATACGNDLDRDEAVEVYVDSNPAASTEEAECVVDRLVAEYGLDGLQAELEAPSPSQPFAVAQFRAEFGCGLRSAVEEQLRADLVAQNIEPEKAACAATELVDQLEESDLDVLLTGELTDGFFDKYFVSLEACGALPA